MPWILLLLALGGCSAMRNAPETPAATTSAAATKAPVVPPKVIPETKPPPSTEPSAEEKAEAELFDRYLLRKLKTSERKALEESCAKDATKNPFCYAVTHFDALEAALHARAERKPRKARVRPRFSGQRIKNWDELRADTLNNLVKTFQRVGFHHLRLAKAIALKETQCPDNAAIAVAARMEDLLPDGANLMEIASLYEKGGDCLTNPDDKENILTRAGLLYYYKKDLAKAVAVLQKSAKVDAAKSPRPLFWLYRIEGMLGDKTAALAAFDKLKEKFPFAFHTVMARLREGQSPDDILSHSAPDETKRSNSAPSANPLVQEAEILHMSGFDKSALKVLDWAIAESQNAEPEFKLYLAELKADMQEKHTAIFLLSKILIDHPDFTSKKTLGLYFPDAFFSLFQKHSQGLDPYLLLAVARQESAFDAHAVSSAKAKGLLQVVARRIRYKKGRKNLLDPETNIEIGARLFQSMLQSSAGQIHLALSAYNAGMLRVTTWTKRYSTTDPLLFIDLIPFKETRAYVGLILRNYYWYRKLHSPGDTALPWLATHQGDKTAWLGSPEIAVKTQ